MCELEKIKEKLPERVDVENDRLEFDDPIYDKTNIQIKVNGQMLYVDLKTKEDYSLKPQIARISINENGNRRVRKETAKEVVEIIQEETNYYSYYDTISSFSIELIKIELVKEGGVKD